MPDSPDSDLQIRNLTILSDFCFVIQHNQIPIEKDDLLNDHEIHAEKYYIHRDARELAEFLHKNPKYKVLFDASRKVKPEDIEFVKQMIDRMGGNND